MGYFDGQSVAMEVASWCSTFFSFGFTPLSTWSSAACRSEALLNLGFGRGGSEQARPSWAEGKLLAGSRFGALSKLFEDPVIFIPSRALFVKGHNLGPGGLTSPLFVLLCVLLPALSRIIGWSCKERVSLTYQRLSRTPFLLLTRGW